MISRVDVKKAVKKLLPAVFQWIDPHQKIKESHDFNVDLEVSDEELEMLKPYIKEVFGIKVKRRELRDCFDVEDLIDLIWGKAQILQQQSNDYFIELLFSMTAKIAKADGVVTQEEINSVENLMMDRLNITPEGRKYAIDCWNKAKNSSTTFEFYVNSFVESFGSNSDLLMGTLRILFEVSASDQKLHHEEERMLRYAVTKFGFTNDIFDTFKDAFFINTDIYYQVLGCRKNDSNDTVRTAYRSLVSELHPDKFASKGLPHEMMEYAKKRLQEINEAWEAIRKERQI